MYNICYIVVNHSRDDIQSKSHGPILQDREMPKEPPLALAVYSPVPPTPYRLDQMARDFLAEAVNRHINRLTCARIVFTFCRLDYLLARHDATESAHHCFKQVELIGGQFDLRAENPAFEQVRIELD